MHNEFAILARPGLVALALLWLSGCATTVFDHARALHHSGQSEAALAQLQAAEPEIPERDRLLLLLERGTLELYSGQYDKAAQSFVAAVDYIEQRDTISVREETRALLSNEATKRYTGEYSERLLAHSYAMLSFLLAGRPASAAVEARRASKRLEAHPDALASAHFTRAIMSLSFESAGQYNDAYVAARALPEASLPATTARLAARLGSTDPQTEVPAALQRALESASGELVLVVAVGQVARKHSSQLVGVDWQIAFPGYASDRQTLPSTRVLLGAEEAHGERVGSEISTLARRSLQARAGRLAARQALRVATKHRLIDELRSRGELVSQLLAFAILASEVADTRGWYALPARLELWRVPVPAGATEVIVQAGSAETSVPVTPLAPGPVIKLVRF